MSIAAIRSWPRINIRWCIAAALICLAAAPAFQLMARGRSSGPLRLVLGTIAVCATVIAVPRLRRDCGWWLAAIWRRAAERDSAGRHARLRLAAVLVWPAACFFLIWPKGLGSGDSWPVIPTAAALVNRGTMDLAPDVASAPRGLFIPKGVTLPYCLVETETGVFSVYPQGMVAFAMPTAIAAKIVRARFESNEARRNLERWTAAWLTALTCGLFFLIAMELAPPASALVATAFLVAGSSMLTTNAQALWQQTGLAFWSLLIVYFEFRRPKFSTLGGIALEGFAAGTMLACRLSSVAILAPLWIWCFAREPKRAIGLALAAAVFFAPWAVANHIMYGTPLGPSYLSQMHASLWSFRLDAFVGVTVSPSHGLFVYQFWFLTPIFAWWLGAPTSTTNAAPRGWQAAIVAVMTLGILINASWAIWAGGCSWGSRLQADTVPLVGLLCVPAVHRLMQAKRYALLTAIGAFACLTQWPAVFTEALALSMTPTETSHLWDWTCPPFVAPFVRR